MNESPTQSDCRVYRYNDGPAFDVEQVSKCPIIPAGMIEDALMGRINDEDPVTYGVRYDAHWLNCNPPSVWPLSTFIGIMEDEGQGNEEHSVLVVEYKCKPLSEPPSRGSSRKCLPPHAEWLRTPLPQPEDDHRDTTHLSWIDARPVSSQTKGIVHTNAGALHLLRSILGPQQDTHPWCHEELYQTSLHKSDIVVLLLAEVCPVLSDFRVSDASPQWFLHSILKLDDFRDGSVRSLFGIAEEEQVYPPSAVLYTYKRLTQRGSLMRNMPDTARAGDTSVKTPTGCLWESFVPPDDEKDGDELRYRIQCPPYLNLEKEYGSLVASSLFSEASLNSMKQEATQIPKWTPWPETQHYSGDANSWAVFPLCYCFPAHDPSKRVWVEATKAFCPKTCEILNHVLGSTLRTALFSQLAPDTILKAHTGWADLANHVLRLHIPLVVPEEGEGLCGTWVDGCVETHEVGRPLLFDDSKIHRAFNYSPDKTRIVLIVDLARPSSLPHGYADGGHTEELDAFIKQMSTPS